MYIPRTAESGASAIISRRQQTSMADFLPGVCLDAAGLVTIAEITAVARRTALTGTSVLSDMFILCPGLHRQQSAPELSKGEYPAVAAMTTGYIFRVENPATVCFLQRVGKTGHLTTLHVSSPTTFNEQSKKNAQKSASVTWRQYLSILQVPGMIPALGSREQPVVPIAYTCAVCVTIAMLIVYLWLQDWWGVFCLLSLVLARLCNILVIQRRCREAGWKGAPEPGVQGDLLVLLSGDCWVRIQGAVDDLKAITAGQWMRDRSVGEDVVSAVATLLVYVSAVLVCNISKTGQVLLLSGMIVSAGLLFLANAATATMNMNGREIRVVKVSKRYFRRRDLADELI
ncbi:uncharacterized protein ANIA_05381 [Aspergillus nidulans FGSC A4]|uniref:Uncharacterized protein n=1 Tax=Emericella nidulans (strain FGSC A4 / ATCC 38163 / CBS 112.46 / NRRL 194 / M139) TaxID=227321 RepID=C8VGP3_EMENI|nr:hypothetical protein [Aspergillus nidulans FGSC A4]CBF82004.1 TPA: conserved hypothetical protein [Aspergillus nidulans FGSC A4]